MAKATATAKPNSKYVDKTPDKISFLQEDKTDKAGNTILMCVRHYGKEDDKTIFKLSKTVLTKLKKDFGKVSPSEILSASDKLKKISNAEISSTFFVNSASVKAYPKYSPHTRQDNCYRLLQQAIGNEDLDLKKVRGLREKKPVKPVTKGKAKPKAKAKSPKATKAKSKAKSTKK